MRLSFVPTLLTWLLVSEPSDCFMPNSPFSTHLVFKTHLDQAQNTSGNGPSKKKKQTQQKKRRFAQEVEPVIEFAPPPKQVAQQQPLFPTKLKGDATKTVSGSKGPNRSKNMGMVQSGKSIEELESIMLKRWGNGDEWKVDFSEWEVADDDGNGAQQSKHARKSISTGRKVRSKPVFNPWEQQEKREEYAVNRKKEEDNAFGNSNISAFQSAKDRQDAVLERAKRNQERLQSKKNQISDLSPTIEFEKDFYDEDDEGYESDAFYNGEDEDLEDEAEDFYNNII